MAFDISLYTIIDEYFYDNPNDDVSFVELCNMFNTYSQSDINDVLGQLHRHNKIYKIVCTGVIKYVSVITTTPIKELMRNNYMLTIMGCDV